MTQDQVRDLLSRLPTWNRFLDSYRLPPVIADEPQLFELRLRLVNLRRRLRDGPLAPLRIAFFGPTGAGKSKLFSSLLGRGISESGYRRPFTRRSRYFVHDDWRSLVAALHGEAELHEDATWRDIILIDTPDFDSVEKENRVEAERVFMESDGFLFVTDALKYADASTWEYLRKITRADKVFQVILNKTNSQTVPLSFEQRFINTFGATEDTAVPELLPLIVMPEFPIDDATLIEADHPALEQIRQAARRLADGNRAELSGEMFAGEARGLFEQAASLLETVEDRRKQIDELHKTLNLRYEECRGRLRDRLSSGLDPAVRDEVYQRVMTRMEAIDVLRHPRRLLSMPVRGLKMLVTNWLPSSQKNDDELAETTVDDPIASETFHLLETELIRLADETRLDIIGTPGLEHLLDRDRFRQLRLDHDDIQQRYAKHRDAFHEWVASHARDTAAEITNQNKIKFILSQLLFNSVVITAQVQTGGLSPLELGVDGVLSPWVAKAVSVAIGNEKVKEFEQLAHDEHQQSLSTVLAVGRDQFAEFLNEAGDGLDHLEETLVEIVGFAPQFDALVEYFEQTVGKTANASVPKSSR